MKNLRNNKKGTALIVALLVMGVLMAISLALSVLVLRESVVTREFLDAGQSFYAAESASEIGLYNVKNNLPGWEPSKSVNIKIDENYSAVAQLTVSNKCKAYPCLEGYDEGSISNAVSGAVSDEGLKSYYAPLGLNESVTIPLFTLDDKGNATKISDFDVEFYSGFDKGDLKIENVEDWDVLRWKIVGFPGKGKVFTESISDFTAVSSQAGKGENSGKFTDPENPSWFGTSSCSDGLSNPSGRLIDVISCAVYNVTTKIAELQNCNQMTAREFYLYNKEGEDHSIGSVEKCYSLSTFVNDHKLNYLTLTNLVNPSMFTWDKVVGHDDKTRIYYRVELFMKDASGQKVATHAVREFADITADGYSGKSKQSVNVKIKRDSFMPVFNFSLYSTYMTNKAEGDGKLHDETFWYADKALKPQLPK